MNRILVLILASFMAACSNSPAVHAKPSAPIDIEYSVPKNVEVGDEVTTVIRFVAKSNLQSLSVSASSYSGLELVSGGDMTEFIELQKGDAREIEVKISLSDEVGYLSVFATTTNALGNVQTKSIAVRYGTAGEATIKKMQSKSLVEGAKGEKLILMPGEAR